MMIMMYGDWSGWGWGWMMLMPLLWIALIAVIVWAVVRLAGRPADRAADQPRRETPQEILDRRFASGEIDADAHTQARDRLAGRQPSSS
jgi:putative membrane protein